MDFLPSDLIRPAFFFPDQLDLSIPVDLHQSTKRASGTSAMRPDHGWSNFETCSLCINRWNRDFCGPIFSGMGAGDGPMRRLTLSVTMSDGVGYRVQTSGYI